MTGLPGQETMQSRLYTGWIEPAYRDPRLPEQLEHFHDLLEKGELLHPGRRSRIIRFRLSCAGGPVEVAVKSFGRQPLLKDVVDRFRGTKARRSWQAACRLRERGAGTPPPIGYLERWEGMRLIECYYLSVFVPGLTSFRRELIRLYREDPVCEKLMNLLQAVASGIRTLHEAGVMHGDLGNQNILVRRIGDAAWTDVQFVDLNRARIRAEPGDGLSWRKRARDLSRIHLPSDFMRVFREMYCAAPPPPVFIGWEQWYRRIYHWHAATRGLRHPFRARRASVPEPLEITYPAEPDIWIWDERSGQAISILRPRDRWRYLPLGNMLRTVAAVLRAAGPMRRHYRRLLEQRYAGPVALDQRFGIALHPEENTIERELALLEGLGRIPVMLRFYHHRGSAHWAFVAQAARALKQRGHSVAAALVQDRVAVREPERWRDFAAQVLAQVEGVADWVEVGHAVNRVKWGIWDWREYARMVQAIADLAPRYPTLNFMGPAGIDFEFPTVLALLGQVPAGFRFRALSHHLYVDRRGAPERTQSGFDLEKKCALARAIAAASPSCEDRLIISEVNWPLQGAGVYSPVGSPYESPCPRFNDPSVTEQDYADFMIRYLALAVCSGLAERVYWWRLVAHGYGLVDDTDSAKWRPRPAYNQFRFFLRQTDGGTFTRRLASKADEYWLTVEAADGRVVILAWTWGDPRPVRWPEACSVVLDAAGRDLKRSGSSLTLGGSPLYFICDRGQP